MLVSSVPVTIAEDLFGLPCVGWIVILVLLVVVSVIIASVQASAATERAQKSREKIQSLSGFKASEHYASRFDDTAIAIDTDTSRIGLLVGGQAVAFAPEEILAVDVVQDGNSLIETNRGSQLAGAVVGGLLAGGIGVLIGGLSGSKRQTSKCVHLGLRIRTKAFATPIAHVTFFEARDGFGQINRKGVSGTSPFLQQPMKDVEKWYTRVAAIIHSSNSSTSTAQDDCESDLPPKSMADELAKLRRLVDDGVLTEDEFAKCKARLLG